MSDRNTPPAENSPAENRLGAETSPYLLQHAGNPVHWRAWGPDALAEAKARNAPVLLSVGYAACHWCHVMAHESFEDDEVARVMNALFVNIKVDREERPDLDGIYQAALQMMGEQGGWPLTMFLTPDAEPFFGGTYYPKTARYGRLGFVDVLQRVSRVYRQDPDGIAKNVASLKQGLRERAQPAGAGSASVVTIAAIDDMAIRIGRDVDPYCGGFGSAPKFPQCGIFELLWRAWLRTGLKPHRDGVLKTLDMMCQGGIYDHLGGGFARYSVDEAWLVPHFEKMLYDNAQLIELMTLVWRADGNPLYRRRVEETIDWTLREMRRECGGFASALDADSEGEEGKFYVWTAAEVAVALGERAAAFERAYDVTPLGNWEGKTILNRARGQMALGTDAEEAALAADRAKLLEVRSSRVRPGLDDKVLADWNGMTIAALAQAGMAFERPDWIEAGRTAFRFVTNEMTVGGRLRHSWRAGQARHPATGDDYAHMIKAAIALFEATADTAALDKAREWVELLDKHYWDTKGGGYFFPADDTTDVIVRSKTASDNATPSGNGVMVGALGRLHLLTGEVKYRDRADALVATFSGDLARQFVGMTTLLNGVEFNARAKQVVIAIPDGDDAGPLVRAALATADANLLFTIVDPSAALPKDHPAAGKRPADGKPTAYICSAGTCSLPVTDPDAVAAAIAGPDSVAPGAAASRNREPTH